MWALILPGARGARARGNIASSFSEALRHAGGQGREVKTDLSRGQGHSSTACGAGWQVTMIGSSLGRTACAEAGMPTP